MSLMKRAEISVENVIQKVRENFGYQTDRVSWSTLIGLIVLHALTLTILYNLPLVNPATILYGVVIGVLSGLGITAGAHRLWAHKSYKARLPLRIFLVFCNTLTLEKSVIHWCRDHRVHHKFSETDADPHNAKRGFFFAHMGWLMLKKHPDVTKKGKTVDISDLYDDPLLKFQHRYYAPLTVLVSLGLCVAGPVIMWSDSLWMSFICFVTRVVVVYHITWLVNSAAHMYGNRPYDKTINPRENSWVAFIALGEGFHNYHHTFPWDYSTSEFGIKLNLTTFFINAMAKLGQAYDLKKVQDKEVKKRAMRTG